MDKIAYIAATEKQAADIRETIGEEARNGSITVQTIQLGNIISEYRRLCAEGYEAILARGGTFQELLAVADSVPVLEARLQTADILLAIKSALRSEGERIYVVIHRTVAIDLEKTKMLYRCPIEVLRYVTRAEMKRLLDEIPQENATVVTSAIAESLTARKDLRIFPLETREATMRETVDRAKNLLRQSRQDIQRMNLLESILSNVNQGIIIFDSDHQVCEVNKRAEELLGQTCDEMMKKRVDEILPDMPRRRNRAVCEEHPADLLHSVGGRMLNVVISPFPYFKTEERYIVTLEDVTRIQDAERHIRRKLAKKGLTANYHFNDIRTTEKNMKKVKEQAKRIAAFEGSVLIYGENGTGKELFAQSIHNASQRKNGPFVAVNCAALTASLLESELFGYEGGAFTGARKEGKAGLFELAHEGTIFLDEINSMPLDLQGKILRVLEQKEVMRVGSDYVIPLDIRVIAATNQPLGAQMADGSFRKDLFFRLNTFEIRIPPLNERPKDVLLLFRQFLAGYEQKKPEEIELPEEFAQMLMAHRWLGNVRELRSTALRYHAYQGDNSAGEILKEESAENVLVTDDLRIDLGKLQSVVEEMVIASLSEKKISKSEMARLLGISRQGLYKKLKRLEE